MAEEYLENKPRKAMLAKRIFSMYADGFRSMTVGRSLWVLILIKLAVIFLVLKLFFFPDLLHQNYDNDDQRARAVMHNLTKE